MAQPIDIALIVDPSYLPGDRAVIEIDSADQPDRPVLTPPNRERRGFGVASAITTPFGSMGLTPPDIPFGAGLFGIGATRWDHTTLRAFVAGDYPIRARGIDTLGNLGDWSDAETIEHRPTPPPPINLSMAGSVLSWTWSDP